MSPADENCPLKDMRACFDGGSQSLLSFTQLQPLEDACPQISRDELTCKFNLSDSSPLTHADKLFLVQFSHFSGKLLLLLTTLFTLSDMGTSELCSTGLKKALTTTSEPIFSFMRGFAVDLLALDSFRVELTDSAVNSEGTEFVSDLQRPSFHFGDIDVLQL